MEDLDPPREEPGAARRILHSLQCHGLRWDETVMWQGRRDPAYRNSLLQLEAAEKLFVCDCTRALLGPGGSCQGHCRARQTQVSEPHATRVLVPFNCRIQFSDTIQGRQASALGRELPDFVLLRKDGLIAYQLAVVVDDAAQGINHVVRGSDLLDSTPRQIYLQQLLGLATPAYSHLPVITNVQGQKFSKQNHAPALNDETAPLNLRQALRFLHQPEPPEQLREVEQVLDFAISRWAPARIPGKLSIAASAMASQA